jgi:hypothetical protein
MHSLARMSTLAEARWYRDVCEHHVTRDLEVHGPLEFACNVNRAMDRRGGGMRVVDNRSPFGDFLVDLVLRLERLHLVMHEQAGPALELPRAPRDDYHRRFLGIRAGNRVNHVQTARAVGDEADPEPVRYARCAIGRKADCGLVTERHETEAPIVLQRVVQVQNEVSRDAEDLVDSVRVQPVEEELMKFHAMKPAHSPNPIRTNPARSQ